jgi:hypothetical protein
MGIAAIALRQTICIVVQFGDGRAYASGVI